MHLKTIAILSVSFLLVLIPMSAECLSADNLADEGFETVTVKNVYSCEFVSLGTLPSYEENTYYFLIKGSANYESFQDYFAGGFGTTIPPDDFDGIQEGDNVVAYYVTSETYSDGYSAVLEFYNFAGTLFKGYLMLNFTMYMTLDATYHFFLKGSTATISWISRPSTTAYFGDINLSKIAEKDSDGIFSASVKIEENGSYDVRFVNTSNDYVSADIAYEIDGYEQSNSTWISVICIIFGALALIVASLSLLKPKWSKESDL